MEGVRAVCCGNRWYYQEKDLKACDKVYFYGCSKARSMIEKKGMKENDYVFAVCNKKTGVWEISNPDYKPSRLLVSKTWADHYVPALRRRPLDHEETRQDEEETQIQMAPPRLELEEDETFRDADGNVLEIEVCGERHHKKCFFLMKDVSNIFNITRLYETLTNNTSSYKKNMHFTYFIRPDPNAIGVQSNEKLMYLMYSGMLKVLFSLRTGNAESFQEWATEKLFTIQMGEEEDRDELAGQLIGVSAKTIHEVFRKNTEKTPCIYLFKICDARQMFPDKTYEKDDIICKYGFTDNLPRRTKEHYAFFEKQKKFSIQLVCFSIIDPKFISDAENHVKRLFRHSSISYEQQTELICIKSQELKDIKTDYGLLQKSYLGCYTELVDRIHRLETEHQKELYQQKLLYQQEKTRADLLEKEIMIKEKELENEVLKRQLLELRYIPVS